MLPRGTFPSSTRGGPRTFSLDPTLPRLPLPTLPATLHALQNALLPFCNSPHEIQLLQQNVDAALSSPTLLQAQRLLEIRHATTAHYVDAWWSRFAYLEDRDPIVPQESAVLDFASPPYLAPNESIPQCLRAALICYGNLLIHKSLCEETFPVVGSSDKPYAMDQFRHVYETCRIPGKGVDKQRYCFHTDEERRHQSSTASSPPTITVSCSGRFYEITCPDYYCITVGFLWSQLTAIKVHAETHPVGSSELINVGFFTGAGREDWAEFRIQLLKENASVLDAIERSILIISLVDSPLTTESVLSDASMSRDGGSRWYDKSAQYVVYANGTAGTSMEHSVMDAAGIFSIHADMERITREWFAECGAGGFETRIRMEARTAMATLRSANGQSWRFLEFVDSTHSLQRAINATQVAYLARRENVWQIQTVRFQGVGKRIIKRLGVSPDSFFQVCLQTTYFDLHQRVPSTYETVGMLPFRLGRTEAGRCATVASRTLCEALGREEAKEDIGALVQDACRAHSEYVRKAAAGQGIDRHIFALKCQCTEAGLPIPELFSNSLWQRASKWDMSTSHAFIELLHEEKGGTSFRPFAPDMTGVVYYINENWIDVTVITCDPIKFNGTVFLSTLGTHIPKLYRALSLHKAKL